MKKAEVIYSYLIHSEFYKRNSEKDCEDWKAFSIAAKPDYDRHYFVNSKGKVLFGKDINNAIDMTMVIKECAYAENIEKKVQAKKPQSVICEKCGQKKSLIKEENKPVYWACSVCK